MDDASIRFLPKMMKDGGVKAISFFCNYDPDDSLEMYISFQKNLMRNQDCFKLHILPELRDPNCSIEIDYSENYTLSHQKISHPIDPEAPLKKFNFVLENSKTQQQALISFDEDEELGSDEVKRLCKIAAKIIGCNDKNPASLIFLAKNTITKEQYKQNCGVLVKNYLENNRYLVLPQQPSLTFKESVATVAEAMYKRQRMIDKVSSSAKSASADPLSQQDTKEMGG